MRNAGAVLKQARERAGFSIGQIAQRTTIQLHNLEALESDRFDVLPTGIYLDGIIRAYAHEVGVDAEPLVERARSERADVAAMWSAPIVLNAVQSEKASHHFVDANVLHVEDTDAGEDANGLDDWMRPRKMELAFPMLAVLAAACVMAFCHQATQPHGVDTAPEPIAYAPWIESPRAAVVPTAPRTVATPASTPVESETAAAHDALPNIAGAWAVATEVESSTYTRFAGLRLGYEVVLEQVGDRISGIGRKIIENGAGIAARAQTPIAVHGRVDGDRVMLDFVERGRRRETQGTFVLTRVGHRELSGKFTTNAARSAGSVEARRVR